MKVEIHNGCFGYRGKLLFDHLNLKVPENKVLTILGANGVGKTTLLRCLMGFLPWKEGETLLNGAPFHSYSHKEVWSHISYVPQAKQSSFSYRVIDTVVMGLNASSSLFSTPSKEDYEKAQAALEWLGLADLAERNCDRVSGGQLQMVLIARALVSDPEVLILDEPESNLDMANQLRVLDVIERIADKGDTTCIINTHFPNNALRISDDTLFLGSNGKQLMGPTKSVINEDTIKEFYHVRSYMVPVTPISNKLRIVFPYQTEQIPAEL